MRNEARRSKSLGTQKGEEASVISPNAMKENTQSHLFNEGSTQAKDLQLVFGPPSRPSEMRKKKAPPSCREGGKETSEE